jgi:hypothetical protein
MNLRNEEPHNWYSSLNITKVHEMGTEFCRPEISKKQIHIFGRNTWKEESIWKNWAWIKHDES